MQSFVFMLMLHINFIKSNASFDLYLNRTTNFQIHIMFFCGMNIADVFSIFYDFR